MSLLRYLRSRRQPCFKKAQYRRNGWDVKPRHGKDPNALIVEDKWWHDSSKSVYWQYFKDDTSFNERTIQAVEFYDEFHLVVDSRHAFDNQQLFFLVRSQLPVARLCAGASCLSGGPAS